MLSADVLATRRFGGRFSLCRLGFDYTDHTDKPVRYVLLRKQDPPTRPSRDG